ncbi:unnamed protein product [Peniophora sp. CBMAI 1063]|nr:unnamed protein product [Peniophora sp. CBMAI 1063]
MTPLRLRCICRRITSIVDNCPLYWSRVLCLVRDDASWKAILPKTKEAPITFRTSSGISPKHQAYELRRTSAAYITRDDPELPWNKLLTVIGALPALRELELKRPHFNMAHYGELQLNAPNLRHLVVDSDATLLTPLLRSLEITRFTRDTTAMLRSVIQASPSLDTLSISDIVSPDTPLWPSTLDVISRSQIATLFVQLHNWDRMDLPPAVHFPTLRRLTTNVPTPVLSSTLEYLDTEVPIDQVEVMLSGVVAVETLKMSLTWQLPDSHEPHLFTILPRCRTMILNNGRSVVDALADFVTRIQAPQLEHFTVHFHPSVSKNAISQANGVPPCLSRNIMRSSMRKAHRQLTHLSSFFEAHMQGTVDLNVHTQHYDDNACITYRISDHLIRARSKPGIELHTIFPSARCQVNHRHADLASIAYSLTAFAWPSVNKVSIASSPSLTRSRRAPHIDPDIFYATHKEDRVLLRRNLELMCGVRTLEFDITETVYRNGSALLLLLAEDTTVCIWPHLEQVRIRGVRQRADGSSVLGEWWKQIKTLLARRLRASQSGSCAPIKIIIASDEVGTWEGKGAQSQLTEVQVLRQSVQLTYEQL